MSKKEIVLKEFTDSFKKINKGDFMLSQILYQLMNFASGGGFAGMPMSAIVSTLIVKGTYDGHRYHKGDENFHKKRRHFYGNMYVGLAGGTIPRMIENAQNIIAENGVETLLGASRILVENAPDIAVVGGGMWNENALMAVLSFQLFHHVKQIIKDMKANKEITAQQAPYEVAPTK